MSSVFVKHFDCAQHYISFWEKSYSKKKRKTIQFYAL